MSVLHRRNSNDSDSYFSASSNEDNNNNDDDDDGHHPRELPESGFPSKLYTVLEESEHQGFEDILSWEGTRAFRIHRPEVFAQSILREYFHVRTFPDFQMQLIIHGFERIENPSGNNNNNNNNNNEEDPSSDRQRDVVVSHAYAHNQFVRGEPSRCRCVTPIVLRTGHSRRTKPAISTRAGSNNNNNNESRDTNRLSRTHSSSPERNPPQAYRNARKMSPLEIIETALKIVKMDQPDDNCDI